MNQNMITVETHFTFSKERLEDIFSVPKTKELYEKLINQEENKKIIKEVEQTLSKLYKKAHYDEKPQEKLERDLKVCLLGNSLESIINGKSLNQALQATICKQLKNPEIFQMLKDNIAELEATIFAAEFLSSIFRSCTES